MIIEPAAIYDLLVVGGGINGAGIARDAAGRGLKVLLIEKGDIASQTSSASTKLIHGGLRYLEQFEFRLVRESLAERERLWRMAPHIIRPMEFLLPQTDSLRPAWLVRLGLFIYDHLGGRDRLPITRTVDLRSDPLGEGLAARHGKGFVYADCWVDDSRLVVLTMLDAAERSALIKPRTELLWARRQNGVWKATLHGPEGECEVRARVLVNATGPWVCELFDRLGVPCNRVVRLVKGSHIIVPRLHGGEHALLIQNPDRRVVFAIPYEGEFTLIGTTEVLCDRPNDKPSPDEDEIAYLLNSCNRTFERKLHAKEIYYTYSGIRPLCDDGAQSTSTLTRDYVLELDQDGPPLLSVFGGKITTYRRLAEQALARLALFFPKAGEAWTGGTVLPGGEEISTPGDYAKNLSARHPSLPTALLERFARTYGSRAERLLEGVTSAVDLGDDLGGGLTQREVDYLVAHEWARTAEDILFRRTKLGLHHPSDLADRIDDYLATSLANMPHLDAGAHAC